MMRALGIFSGVLIWALHFGALYGLTTLACARGWSISLPFAVAAVTLVAVVAALAVAAYNYPRRAELIAWMTTMVAALALIAIVWAALPVVWLPRCASS